MKILWSEEAINSFENIANYLIENWSFAILEKFQKKVNALLTNLSIHNKLCPVSLKALNLRKCIISKQTSLIYRINNNNIEILLFIDNRSKHNY